MEEFFNKNHTLSLTAFLSTVRCCDEIISGGGGDGMTLKAAGASKTWKVRPSGPGARKQLNLIH